MDNSFKSQNLMKFKKSKYVISSDDLINDKRILYSTRTGEILSVKNEIYEYIESQNYHEIKTKTLVSLMNAGIIVPEEQNELEYIINEFKQHGKNTKVLGFVIQPSANCQLGCNYCGQKHTKHNLSNPDIEVLYEHIIKKITSGKFRGLNILWYGAEPLMSFSNIVSLSKKLIEYCDKNNIKYSSSMITNGVNLKLNIFKQLAKDCKVNSYQITLDGDKDIHDKQRMTKKNIPTFDIIYQNIKNAVNDDYYKEFDVMIGIRCNITVESSKGINKLLEKLKADQIHDKIHINFEPVHDWGKNEAHKIGFTKEEFAEKEIDWFLDLKEMGFKVPELIPHRIYSTCMITDNESELIDAYGNISYCWETTYTPHYENSDYIIGTINRSGVYSERSKQPLRNWYDLI